MEEIIRFMKDELKIKISKEKEQKIIEKFTDRTYDDMVYWYIDIDERKITFFFDGFITKQDYEKIKTLDDKTELCFGEIAKHTEAEAYLSELSFVENKEDILKRVKGNKRNDFDLMEYLHNQDIMK